MNILATKLKKVPVFLSVLLFAGLLLVPLISPTKVSAAGETWAYTADNQWQVRGGDLSAPANFTQHIGEERDDTTTNHRFTEPPYILNVYRATLQHNSGCTIVLDLGVPLSDGTPFLYTDVTGGSCSNAIKSSYDHLTITDAVDDRGSIVGELPVSVTLRFWGPNAVPPGEPVSAPATIALQLKTPNGSNVGPASLEGRKTDVQETYGEDVYTFSRYDVTAGTSVDLFKGDSYQLCPKTDTSISCINFVMPDDFPGGGEILEINNRPTPAGADDVCDTDPGELNFLVCPAINLIADTAQKLDCIIINLLVIDTDPIFGGSQGTQDHNPGFLACMINAGVNITEPPANGGNQDTSDGFRKAWGVFRAIAFGLLLIFALVMVISQIMGLEIFDAYTIRKMLPRLIIAVIFIALSWNIMNFLFNLSNDGAFAVMELIRAPFSGVNANDGTGIVEIGLSMLIPQMLLIGIPAAGAAVLGVAAILGIGGVLAVIVSVLLGVFTAFVLLAARNVVAYLLIIIAPLAIICSTFEPFKKLFTLWKGLLITILLSVPAVAAVIEMSHVGALVSYTANSGLATLTAIVILIAGYAMIWSIFKKLDQVTGQLGNIASSFTGRAQQALAKYRNNTFKRRFGEAMAGERTFGKFGIGATAAASLGRRVQLAGKPGGSFFGPKSDIARQGADAQAAEEMLKRDGGRYAGYDELMEVLSGLGVGATKQQAAQAFMARKHQMGETGFTLKEAEDAIDQAEASFGGSVGSSPFTIATAKAALASSTSFREEKWRDADTALQSARDTMHRLVQQGAITYTQAAAIMTSNKQRLDLAGAGFAATMQYIEGKKDMTEFRDAVAVGNNAYSTYGQRWETARAAAQHAQSQLRDLYEARDATGDRKTELEAKLRARKLLEDRNGDKIEIDDAITRLYAQIDSGYQVAKSVAPLNAQYMSDILLSYTPPGQAESVAQEITRRKREDPRMQQYGYEYLQQPQTSGVPPAPGQPAPPGTPGQPPSPFNPNP